MDIDEDDDFYANDEGAEKKTEQPEKVAEAPQSTVKSTQEDEDLEEGEEEDEADSGSDSDIDIITERKDGLKAAPPSQPKYNEIRNISQRTGSTNVVTKAAVIKKEPAKAASLPSGGADLPDLNENDKPWRRPGTDVSDYFNYGFDEFTWALYASKQETVRSEVAASNPKKMLEDMMMMTMMPGMVPGAAGGAGMPGMEGMTPEMMQQMQAMMTGGMDPSQMDPSAMFGQGGAGGVQGNQGFGGQGFGQGQNQFGYDQGGGNRGGNFGKGRAGRRGGW
ncbi:fip1 domain-containing protein [Diplocarpon mali]|nr:fip1 domain-containing protein [Diplocarpon mali]